MAGINWMALKKLKRDLGRRRFRMAFLRFGHNLTHKQIAQQMRVCRQMVTKDLAKIERHFGDLRRHLMGDDDSPSEGCWQTSTPSLN